MLGGCKSQGSSCVGHFYLFHIRRMEGVRFSLLRFLNLNLKEYLKQELFFHTLVNHSYTCSLVQIKDQTTVVF